MSTTTTDADLEVLREAGEIIEEITEGKVVATAHRLRGFDMIPLFLRLEMARGRFVFNFENAEGKADLRAWREQSFGRFDERRLYYDGPWRNGRPRWTPEGVAGLVLATIGMWADPKNVARAD